MTESFSLLCYCLIFRDRDFYLPFLLLTVCSVDHVLDETLVAFFLYVRCYVFDLHGLLPLPE